MNQTTSRPALIDFEVFWTNYPLKQGKAAALKAWSKLKPDDYVAAEIIEGVQKHQRSNKKWKEGYIPMASTFLNQERWKDELGPSRSYQPANPQGATMKQLPSWGGYESQEAYEKAHTPSMGILLMLIKQSPKTYAAVLKTWGYRMPKRVRDPLFKAAGLGEL